MSTALLQPTRRRRDPADDVRRREFLAGVLAAGFLAACGDEGDDGAATDSGFPVTIDHSFGSTTIRARPRRVVSLDIYETDAVVALGLERQARKAVADLDARLAQGRRTLGLDGKTVAIGFYDPGSGFFPGADDSNMATLRPLGARPGPRLVDLPAEEPVSLERVDRFEADVLFVSCETPKLAADLKAEPLFRSLDVVKRGAVLVSSDPLDTDLLAAKGLLSVAYALDHLYPRLARLAEI